MATYYFTYIHLLSWNTRAYDIMILSHVSTSRVYHEAIAWKTFSVPGGQVMRAIFALCEIFYEI